MWCQPLPTKRPANDFIADCSASSPCSPSVEVIEKQPCRHARACRPPSALAGVSGRTPVDKASCLVACEADPSCHSCVSDSSNSWIPATLSPSAYTPDCTDTNPCSPSVMVASMAAPGEVIVTARGTSARRILGTWDESGSSLMPMPYWDDWYAPPNNEWGWSSNAYNVHCPSGTVGSDCYMHGPAIGPNQLPIKRVVESEKGSTTYVAFEAPYIKFVRTYPVSTAPVRTIGNGANWWDSFNSAGWSLCPTPYHAMYGLYRSPHEDISSIESANCGAIANLPLDAAGQPDVECMDHDISTSFDHQGDSTCPDGYWANGLYRASCNFLWCIEYIRCCRQKGGYNYGVVKERVDVSSSFDSKGMQSCSPGYFMTGMFRSGDIVNNQWQLWHIEYLLCAKFKPQPPQEERYMKDPRASNLWKMALPKHVVASASAFEQNPLKYASKFLWDRLPKATGLFTADCTGLSVGASCTLKGTWIGSATAGATASIDVETIFHQGDDVCLFTDSSTAPADPKETGAETLIPFDSAFTSGGHWNHVLAPLHQCFPPAVGSLFTYGQPDFSCHTIKTINTSIQALFSGGDAWDVTKVKISNRVACCQERLGTFEILALRDQGWETCYSGTMTDVGPRSFACNAPNSRGIMLKKTSSDEEFAEGRSVWHIQQHLVMG